MSETSYANAWEKLEKIFRVYGSLTTGKIVDPLKGILESGIPARKANGWERILDEEKPLRRSLAGARTILSCKYSADAAVRLLLASQARTEEYGKEDQVSKDLRKSIVYWLSECLARGTLRQIEQVQKFIYQTEGWTLSDWSDNEMPSDRNQIREPSDFPGFSLLAEAINYRNDEQSPEPDIGHCQSIQIAIERLFEMLELPGRMRARLRKMLLLDDPIGAWELEGRQMFQDLTVASPSKLEERPNPQDVIENTPSWSEEESVTVSPFFFISPESRVDQYRAEFRSAQDGEEAICRKDVPLIFNKSLQLHRLPFAMRRGSENQIKFPYPGTEDGFGHVLVLGPRGIRNILVENEPLAKGKSTEFNFYFEDADPSGDYIVIAIRTKERMEPTIKDLDEIDVRIVEAVWPCLLRPNDGEMLHYISWIGPDHMERPLDQEDQDRKRVIASDVAVFAPIPFYNEISCEEIRA